MSEHDPDATTPSGDLTTQPIPVAATTPPGGATGNETGNPAGPVAPAPVDAAPAPEGPKQKFSDRLWSLRAVIAVAVASVLLGGAGGAALAAVSHDSGQNGRVRFGPHGPGFGGPGQGHFPRFGHQRSGHGPSQQNGQQSPQQNGTPTAPSTSGGPTT